MGEPMQLLIGLSGIEVEGVVRGNPTSLCPIVEDPLGYSTVLNANNLDE